MQLNHDNSGFLVGERLSAEDVTGRLDAIRDELRALRKDIGGHSVGSRGAPVANKPTEANSSPAPRQAKPEAATPRHDEIVVRVDQEKPPAVAATSQQRDLGQYVYSQAVAPDSPANQAPFNLNTASTVSPSRSVGSNAAAATPSKDIGGQSVGGRDASGRFVPKEGGSAGNAQDEEDSNGLLMKSINGLGDRMAGAAREIGAGSEEADPTVKAFNEVAQPLSRGFGKIMGDGSDRKQERWYRRFWLMMRGTRREDREEGKQQRRILKNIERKPTGGDSGSMLWRLLAVLLMPLGALVSLAMSLPLAIAGAFVAGLKSLLTAIGLGGAAVRIPIPGRSRDGRSRTASPGQPSTRGGRQQGQAGGGVNSGGSSRPSGIGGALKQGARRLPGVGALLGLGFMANDIASSERSDATREEKNVKTGRAAGRGLGGIGGMAGGALTGAAVGSIVPVIGTAVGGIVGAIAGGYFGGNAGEVLGEKAGQWLNTMKDSSLFQGMADSWHYASDFTSSLWESATDAVSTNWKGVTDRWDNVSTTVSDGWGKATDAITDRWETVTGEMKDRWGDAVDLAAKGWEALTSSFGVVNDWIELNTGIDVGGAISDLSSSAVQSAANIGNQIADRAESASNAVSNLGERAWENTSSGASAVFDWAANTTPGLALRDAKEEASTNLAGRRNSRTAEPALTAAMADAGITDPNEQAAFMGQMHHESGGFTQLEESLYYTPERLQQVWPSRFPDEASTEGFARNPEALGNHVYGGRMGNTEPGDGYRYRGRGFTQLTGKDNYTAASESLGIDLVNNPDMAADPEVAAKVATWYWQNREGLSEAAQSGDTREVTRLINGGDNGLADREAQTSRYLAAAEAGEFTPSSVSEPSINNVAARQSTPETTATVSTDHLRAMGLSATRAPALGSASPQLASIPPLRVPPVGEAPTVSVPLSSSGERTNGQQASRAPQDVSRDLGDRRIAHIVTGSYSGMG